MRAGTVATLPQCRRRIAGAAVSVLLSAYLLASDTVSAADQPAGGTIPWIDVHVHLLSRTGPQNDFAGAARAAVDAMDSGQVKSVVMPMPQVSGGRPPFDWRDFAEALKQFPGRFAFLGGGGALNPIIMDNAGRTTIDDKTKEEFTRIAEEIIAAGASGFGEIAAHHLSAMSTHPYESVAANHPLLLLLADIAARHDAVIDLHFDVVLEETGPPPQFRSPLNPTTLKPNLAECERLLAHNRAAKIVWAHAGSDPLGNLTPALSRELLARHPNLYMSLRMPGQLGPGSRPPMAGQPGMFPGGQMPGRPGMPPGGMRGGPMGGPGARMGPGAPMAPGGPGMGPGGPMSPGGPMGQPRPMSHMAFSPQGTPNPEWLAVVTQFADRFVLGGDQFVLSPGLSGSGAGTMFAQFAPVIRQRAQGFLAALPPDVARKVGTENAERLYKVKIAP